MSEGERLEEYRIYKRMPKKEFASFIGYSTVNSLHGILNGNRQLSVKVIRHIVANCPDLSIKWLLTGKGEMLIPQKEVPNNLKEEYLKLVKENSNLKTRIITLLDNQYSKEPILVQ
ncbi:MAG: hypothetical protein ACPGVD_11675 [Flavobacteriales bacterium]